MCRTAACLLAYSCAWCSTTAAAPVLLRVDLHLHADCAAAAPVFVSLDAVTGLGPNVSFVWALLAGVPTQSAARVVVTTPTDAATGANAWTRAGCLARRRRSACRAHSSRPRRRMTGRWRSATVAACRHVRWRGSVGRVRARVWAAPCAGGAAPPPAFARFHAAVALPAGRAPPLSALLYVTGASPVYSDPWNVAKLQGDFALRVGGDAASLGRLVGVGPGKLPCGPVPMSACAPGQPSDGFDVRADVVAAVATGAPLARHRIVGAAVAGKRHCVSVQAVLLVRWSPAGAFADSVVGTDAVRGGPWLALDADPLARPGANNAPFWYVQPREDMAAPRRRWRGRRWTAATSARTARATRCCPR